jgi:hypothetical protein
LSSHFHCYFFQHLSDKLTWSKFLSPTPSVSLHVCVVTNTFHFLFQRGHKYNSKVRSVAYTPETTYETQLLASKGSCEPICDITAPDLATQYIGTPSISYIQEGFVQVYSECCLGNVDIKGMDCSYLRNPDCSSYDAFKASAYNNVFIVDQVYVAIMWVACIIQLLGFLDTLSLLRCCKSKKKVPKATSVAAKNIDGAAVPPPVAIQSAANVVLPIAPPADAGGIATSRPMMVDSATSYHLPSYTASAAEVA